MKKSTFVNLIIGTVGGLLFSLGVCMCLLPQWNAFHIGVICTAAGALILLVQALTAWVRSGRKVKINWKLTFKVLYGVIAALTLGLGMCMIMVWNLMLPSIAVGVAGIIMLLVLIPMFVGLK